MEIRTTSLPGVRRTAFITLSLQPGLYRLTFEPGWPERLGLVLTCMTSTLLVTLPLTQGRCRFLDRLLLRLDSDRS